MCFSDSGEIQGRRKPSATNDKRVTAVKTYDFAYGHGRKTFDYYENHVIKEVRTEEFPVMEDVKAGVLDAIYHPIG